MDTLDSMRIFAAVAEAGSFVGAAARLELSPAAVSKAVAALEAHLATRLIQRTTRRMSLTEAGSAYLERASAILADIDSLEASVGALSAEPRGTLKINAPVSFGLRYLGPALAQFMRRYPRVTVDVTLGDRFVDLVDEGFDMALRITRKLDTQLVARPLASSRIVVCAAPAYLARHGTPRHPRDLARHRILFYTYGIGEWQLSGPGGTHAVRIDGAARANNGDLIEALAVAGEGICVSPMFIAADDLRAGRLVRILPRHEAPRVGIYAVYPHRQYLSAKVRAWVDFLVETFGGQPPWERATQIDKPRVTRRSRGA